MTDKKYIRRSNSTREQRRRRRELRRNLTILAIVLLIFLAILLLLGAGGSGTHDQNEPYSGPVVVTASPVKIQIPKPTPAPTQEPKQELHYPLTDEERQLVERVVFAESGNQSLEGQMAVAQCILNTAGIRDIRPDEVVLEPNQYAAQPVKTRSQRASERP